MKTRSCVSPNLSFFLSNLNHDAWWMWEFYQFLAVSQAAKWLYTVGPFVFVRLCGLFFCRVSIFGFSRDPQHLPLGSQGTAYLKRVSKPYYLCEAEGHGTSNLQTDQRRNQKYPKHAEHSLGMCLFLSGRDASPGQLCVKLRSETFWFWMISWWLSPRAITTWLAEWENSFTEL